MTSNAIRGIRRKKSSLSEVKVAVIGAPAVGKSGEYSENKKNYDSSSEHGDGPKRSMKGRVLFGMGKTVSVATRPLTGLCPIWSSGRMTLLVTGVNLRTHQRKIYLTVTSHTTNPTRVALCANPGIRGQNPATSHLIHCTAQKAMNLLAS